MYGASCADAETKRSDSDGVSATRASHLGPKLGTQPLELQAGADHLHPHVRIDVAEAAEEGREGRADGTREKFGDDAKAKVSFTGIELKRTDRTRTHQHTFTPSDIHSHNNPRLCSISGSLLR